jgi:hypothetical protein
VHLRSACGQTCPDQHFENYSGFLEDPDFCASSGRHAARLAWNGFSKVVWVLAAPWADLVCWGASCWQAARLTQLCVLSAIWVLVFTCGRCSLLGQLWLACGQARLAQKDVMRAVWVMAPAWADLASWTLQPACGQTRSDRCFERCSSLVGALADLAFRGVPDRHAARFAQINFLRGI